MHGKCYISRVMGLTVLWSMNTLSLGYYIASIVKFRYHDPRDKGRNGDEAMASQFDSTRGRRLSRNGNDRPCKR
jgi:hypothetical protein